MDEACRTIISYNFLIRIGVSILAFATLYNTMEKNILLILPILLTILDFTDNTLSHPTKKCAHTFFYQSKDKVVDLLSYIAAWKLFWPNGFLLFFILWRAVGILLFLFSKQSFWLVIFLDFVKEFMLYSYFFENFAYLPLAVLAKAGFEYYMHTIHLPQEY